MNNENQKKQVVEQNDVSLKELMLKTRDWWRYLLSKWLIILIVGLIGGILGFFYAKSKKPVYTASTTFVLEEEKGAGGLGNLAGLASMAGIDLGGGGGGIFRGDNIFELYKSRKIILETLLSEVEIDGKQQTLIDRYLDFTGMRESWAEKPQLLALKFVNENEVEGQPILTANRSRDSILTMVTADIAKNYLSVAKPNQELAIIQVDVIAEDESFAKTFNEEIVKNVNDFYVRTKIKKSLQNVKILAQKTDSVRRVMNGDIYTAVAVADATPNLNPTRQIKRVAPAQRAQFSAETNKAVLSTLVQNLEISKMSLMKETPLLEVIDQPIYPLKTKKFGKSKGIIAGGMLGGFLVCFILIIRRVFKSVLA